MLICSYRICRISVKEAADSDTLIRERALIAPGTHHLLLKRSNAHYFAGIKTGSLTLARDQPSFVISGVSHQAVKHGAVACLLPFEAIAGVVLREAG